MDKIDWWNVRFIPTRKKVSDSTKRLVMSNQDYNCKICGNKLPPPPHQHFHHKKFASKGGSNNPKNIIAVYDTCHKAIHKKKGYGQKRQIKKEMIH